MSFKRQWRAWKDPLWLATAQGSVEMVQKLKETNALMTDVETIVTKFFGQERLDYVSFK